MATIIAVTPPYFYQGEARAIELMLEEARADLVHIRKPEASADELRTLVEAIGRPWRERIALHSHFALAGELGIGGIHLNSRSPKPPHGWTGRVSRSCHSLAELADTAGLCYVFLSPVFPSFSKPGHASDILSDPALCPALRSAAAPVIALGGVTRADIPRLLSLGFAGAAMMSEAWRSAAMDTHRFRLQLITHPVSGRTIKEGARQALAGGCRWIQLRHKDAPDGTLADEGHFLALLPEREGFTFIIDDHVELVEPLGADGVHLGKNDMPVAAARRILGPSKIIGATANTLEDMVLAARDGADYIGLGPFRFTSTKARLSPTLGLEGYRCLIAEARDAGVRIPVVAIGGITPGDVAAIMATGADGVAVSGAILSAPDPVAETHRFIDILDKKP